MNTLMLLEYNRGHIPAATMLVMYPAETQVTLDAKAQAHANHKGKG